MRRERRMFLKAGMIHRRVVRGERRWLGVVRVLEQIAVEDASRACL